MTGSTAAQRNAAAADAKTAKTKFDAEDWFGALDLYQSALRIAPDHSRAWYWCFRSGLCQSRLKRWLEAAEAYTKAIELNGEYTLAFNNRGNCHFALQNNEHALADYNAAIRLDPDRAQAYASRSDVWKRWKQWNSAIEDLNKALSLTADPWRVEKWRKRLVALEEDAKAAARKRSNPASGDGSAAGDASDDPPSKRLKAADSKDVKTEGMGY
jgi:tetratricopeptide (TPR) repeat protein